MDEAFPPPAESHHQPNEWAPPPTAPGTVAPREKPTQWPTIIGVIAIVFGIFGAMQGLCGIVSTLAAWALVSAVNVSVPADDPSIAVLELTKQYQWHSVAASLIITLVALALVWGGITLLKRRRVSRAILLRWSVAKIIIAVVYIAWTYYVQQLTNEAMQKAMQDVQQTAATAQPGMTVPPGMPAGMMATMHAFQTAMLVLFLLWLWALPVFLLVWFNRAAIKAETRSWT